MIRILSSLLKRQYSNSKSGVKSLIIKDVNMSGSERNTLWETRKEETKESITVPTENELHTNKSNQNVNPTMESNFKTNADPNLNPQISATLNQNIKNETLNLHLDPMQQLVYDVTQGNIEAELHHVYTIDGFELNLYRMVKNKRNHNCNNNQKKDIEEKEENRKKEVFCLNHGLFESCINFAAKGYDSLAFEIFMNGHDVWLCNNRGNSFTKYVGRKVAWRKLLERYDLEELEKDLGFCAPPNILMKYSKVPSEEKESKEKVKKRKKHLCTYSKDNVQGKPKYCSNFMCWSSPVTEEKQMHTASETTNVQTWNYLNLFSFLNGRKERGSETEVEQPQISLRKESITSFLHHFISLQSEEKTETKESNTMHSPKKRSREETNIQETYDSNYCLEEEEEEEEKENENEEVSDWTFEDMSTKDLPVIIKYIKTETKKDKIVFIGFSQGSIQLLISSCLNEYVSKSIKQCYLISLPIILRNKYELVQSMKLLIRLSKCSDFFLKGKSLAQRILPDKICELVIANTAHTLTHKYLKYYTENIDNHYKKVYFYHTPNGNTSAANLNKWIEGLNNNPVTTIIEQNINRCAYPKTLIYGSKDTIVDSESSIQYMNKIFKTKLKIILHNNWSHLDPVWSDNNRIVSSHILNDLKNESK